MNQHYLLDTHIILALVDEQQDQLPGSIRTAIIDTGAPVWVSVLSLWEIAIKTKIGKLSLSTPLVSWPDALFLLGAQLLEIKFPHVVADIGPEPATKDPFDRLLLGICAAENFKLVTLDRALSEHPLAWSVPAVK